MPRKHPLPQSERDVGARLRWVRMATGLSRADFCKLIGVPWSTYVNYEWGNSKVPMLVGWNVCHFFGVNQEWLATGKEPRRPAYQLHTLLLPDEAWEVPFSDGFDRYLRHHIERRRAEERRAMGETSGAPAATEAEISPLGGSEMALPYSVDMLKASAERLPLHLHWKLFDAVVRAVRELDEVYGAEIRKHQAAMEQGKGTSSASHWRINVEFCQPGAETGLTSITPKRNTHSVTESTPTWEEIVERAKAVTTAPGSKAELAGALGVKPPRLSEWLAGGIVPGAKVAFSLFARVVELEESAKRKVAGGRTPATTTTRTKKKRPV